MTLLREAGSHMAGSKAELRRGGGSDSSGSGEKSPLSHDQSDFRRPLGACAVQASTLKRAERTSLYLNFVFTRQ